MKTHFHTFAVVGCLLAMSTAGAQVPAGTIYGTISDSTGARLPGAVVVIVHEGTNATREVVTDDQGRLTVGPLPIGRYTIRATFQGFQATEARGVALQVDERREVNLTLGVAGSQETVTVAAEVPLIERSTSSLGQVIQERDIVELPLNGRNLVQLGTLAPGAVKSEGTQFNNPSASTSIRGSTSLSANGMKENANDWLLDGVDNNELTAGAISVLPSPDAIEEFKVMTSNYSAQFGRNGGATVAITTKSGSNRFSGTLFEFLRNDMFDAKNFFDVEKGVFRQNQFGFSLGGPISRDHVFFFGDYQGTRIRKALPFISSVPTARMRAGDFGEVGPVFDPCLTFDAATRTCTESNQGTRQEFVNRVIPADRIDPIALRVLDYYPLPNRPGVANNFTYSSKREMDQDQFDLKVTHVVGTSDNYFARFSYDDAFQFFPGPLPGYGGGASNFISATLNDTKARHLSAAYNKVISPRLVNELVGGFNRIYVDVVGPSFGTDVSAQIGIPGANLGDEFTSGLTRFALQGFNGLGDRLATPLQLGTTVYQLSDNLNMFHGAHSIKTGFSFRLNHMNYILYTSPRGVMNFTSLFTAQRAGGSFVNNTGHSVASLLLGLPADLSRSNAFGEPETRERWTEWRGYIQDDWRVTDALTLNLGLAYKVTTPRTEADNRLSFFDPNTGTMLVARADGVSDTVNVETDWSGVQPRFGFAYSAGGKTVIRGGYGIFSDWAQGGLTQPNPPFADTPSFVSNSITPVGTLSTGFPAPVQPNPSAPRGSVTFMPTDYEYGFVQQWNIGVQRDIGWSSVATVTYVGSSATRLLSKEGNFNAPPPGAGGIDPRRPFPTLSGIQETSSRGEARYNALQFKLERRGARFYVLAGYTLSKARGNEGPQSLTFQAGAAGTRYYPFEPFGEDTDDGYMTTDVRHSFTASYLYTTPGLEGRDETMRSILGDWQVGGIVRARSGYPLGMTITPSLLNNGMANRPNQTCSGELDNPTIQRWFDTSCFQQPAAFEFGDSPRTTDLRGPGLINFDMSLSKTLGLVGRTALQFRTEVFNIFNTPQFDIPSTAIGTGAAGTITATVNDARVVQFGLKLLF